MAWWSIYGIYIATMGVLGALVWSGVYHTVSVHQEQSYHRGDKQSPNIRYCPTVRDES